MKLPTQYFPELLVDILYVIVSKEKKKNLGAWGVLDTGSR